MIKSSAKVLAALILAALTLTACGKSPRTPSGVMDTPEHHYKLGTRFLDQGDIDRAEHEFQKALDLKPSYGPAFSGLGVVMAAKGDKDESEDMIDKGLDQAETDQEKILALADGMRTLPWLARSGLADSEEVLDRSEDYFEQGIDLAEDEPLLYLARGEAAVWALEFDLAEKMFQTVLTLKNGLESEADARWRMVQKIKRAAPVTSVGKRIGLVERISRADMAALLVEELGVERFYGRTGKSESPRFRPPGSLDPLAAGPLPVDIEDHPMRSDIEIVIEYGVRGLTTFPDGMFRPQKELSRAEAAMILEDIVVRAKNDPGLATSFIGRASPFGDMRGDHPAFNAAMLCSTRGLLEAEPGSGNFRPLDPVSGADAVLAVSRLRSELSPF